MFALCGISHITLSAKGLALLQSTPLDEHFERIRDKSLNYFKENVQYDSTDPFFNPKLDQALADPKVQALQVDALAHFEAAEVALRAIAKENLRDL